MISNLVQQAYVAVKSSVAFHAGLTAASVGLKYM